MGSLSRSAVAFFHFFMKREEVRETGGESLRDDYGVFSTQQKVSVQAIFLENGSENGHILATRFPVLLLE